MSLFLRIPQADRHSVAIGQAPPQNAASIAALLLATETLIIDEPELKGGYYPTIC